MPVTTILDGSGTRIWSGEARVHVTGPDRPGACCRLAISQERLADDHVVGRTLDLGCLGDVYSVDWTVEYDVPQPSADPDDVSVGLPVFSERAWTLRIDAPRALLDHIARQLDEPLTTEAEREAIRERERTMREEWEAAVLQAFDFPDAAVAVLPRSDADIFQDVHFAADRAADAIRRAGVAVEGFVQGSRNARRILVRPDGPPDWSLMEDAFRRNEEVITSAREEFPYDPLQYGRIYPGNAGTSHWTPPDDPDEKIRSCP